MSTLKTNTIQHISSSTPSALTTSTGDLTNAAGVSYMANKNLLYNGAMQIHQRSASVAGITTSGYYTADRMSASVSSLGTWTQTVEVDAPTGSGLRKSIKMLCTTADASPAATDVLLLEQNLEGQDVQRVRKGTSSAQQLTLSFWVKSNVTGTYIAELRDNDNNRSVSVSYNIISANTWEFERLTFPADTVGVFDNDNALSLEVSFWLAAGSNFTSGSLLQTTWGTLTSSRAVGQTNLASATNNYWQMTGAQLEIGPVATSFEFKSFGNELRECQRYYEKSYDIATNPGSVTGTHQGAVYYNNNNATFNTFFTIPVTFNVYKRGVPVVTVYSPGTGASAKVQVNTAGNPDVTGGAATISMQGFSGGITSGSGGSLMAFNWVANAEL
jgi:hypothetical protein